MAGSSSSSKYQVVPEQKLQEKHEETVEDRENGEQGRGEVKVEKEGSNHQDQTTAEVSSSSSSSNNNNKQHQTTSKDQFDGLRRLAREKYARNRKNVKRTVATDWSENQQKLLYLISTFSQPPVPGLEEKTWIREIPLLILLYEGIVAKVFDYDYAPSLEVFGNRTCFLNVAQEAREDLLALVQSNLVSTMTFSSSDYTPVAAFRVSERAVLVLQGISSAIRKEVDSFALAPGRDDEEVAARLLHVRWDEQSSGFQLVASCGYKRQSNAGEIEAMSFVCSPFIPKTLQRGKVPAGCVSSVKSNIEVAKMAVELIEKGRQASSSSSLSGAHFDDDILEGIIHAKGVRLIITDWVPFGANRMDELQKRFSLFSCGCGGLCAALVDKVPGTTTLAHPLKKVGVLSLYLFLHTLVFFPVLLSPSSLSLAIIIRRHV